MNLRGGRALAAAGLLLLGLLPPAERLAARIATTLALPLSALPIPGRYPSSALSAEEREADRAAVTRLVESEARSLLPEDATLRSRRFVYAGVTSREAGGGILRIDVGEEEGIRPGLAAIAGDALVGFVRDVGARTSSVLTLLHHGFVAPGAYKVPPQESGGHPPRLVVRGTGSDHLAIELSELRDPATGLGALCLGDGEGVGAPAEADGFRIGRVEEVASGSGRDVRSSSAPDVLSALLVVLPGPADLVIPNRLSEERFRGRRVSVALRRIPDLSAGRRSLLLRIVGPGEVREGDALVVGERLVGVIETAAFRSARARALDDPASRIEGILVSPDRSPVPLGPLRPQEGAFRIRLEIGTVSGTLHAGPIGPSLPRGLVLGRAEVSGDRVRLDPGVEPRGLDEAEVLGGEDG